MLPGLFDGRDKAFFFVNYEQLRFPNSFTRNRTVLHPLAQQGIFRYSVGGQVREVNVLELAARNGQIATKDPTVRGMLNEINRGDGHVGRPVGAERSAPDELIAGRAPAACSSISRRFASTTTSATNTD